MESGMKSIDGGTHGAHMMPEEFLMKGNFSANSPFQM